MAFQSKLAREIGLTDREIAIFRKLKRPEDIQDYITARPSKAEPDGDTSYSVRTAIARNRCHCIEAAFIAACVLVCVLVAWKNHYWRLSARLHYTCVLAACLAMLWFLKLVSDAEVYTSSFRGSVRPAKRDRPS